MLSTSGGREAALHFSKWTSRRTVAHPNFPLSRLMVSCSNECVCTDVHCCHSHCRMLLCNAHLAVQVRSWSCLVLPHGWTRQASQPASGAALGSVAARESYIGMSQDTSVMAAT